jgi:hypothetical protein
VSNPYAGLTDYELLHLPAHLSDAGIWDELEFLLTDLEFVEGKCAAGMTFDLELDYQRALDRADGTATARPRSACAAPRNCRRWLASSNAALTSWRATQATSFRRPGTSSRPAPSVQPLGSA